MANKKRAIHLDTERLELVLKERGLSKTELQKQLYAVHPYNDETPLISRRQFFNNLKEQECQPLVLDEMAKLLNVDPLFLTGNINGYTTNKRIRSGTNLETGATIYVNVPHFHKVSLADIPYRQHENLDVKELREQHKSAFDTFIKTGNNESVIIKYESLSDSEQQAIINSLDSSMKSIIDSILNDYYQDLIDD